MGHCLIIISDCLLLEVDVEVNKEAIHQSHRLQKVVKVCAGIKNVRSMRCGVAVARSE